MINISSGYENINVSYFNQQPKLYFEQIQPVYIFSQSWKLVTSCDLSSYSKQFKLIRHYIDLTSDLCNKLNERGNFTINRCDNTLFNLNLILETIDHTHSLILQIIDTPEDQNLSRHKRGLVDVVGKAAKYLFGVLDEDDAEHYNSIISNLSKTNTRILHTNQKQTTIMSSITNSLQESLTKIGNNFESLKHRIKDLEDWTKIFSNAVDRRFESDELYTNLNELLILTSTLLTQFQITQINLLNILYEAQKGIVHPMFF